MLALDTETELIAPGRQAPPLVCVSISNGESSSVLHWSGVEGFLSALFAPTGGPIVGCNIAFDCSVIVAQFPDLAPAVFAAYDADRITDVAIRQKLIDLADGSLGWGSVDGKRTRFRYSLDELTRRHFGVSLDKASPWRTRYAELRHLPISSWPAEAIDYSRADADATAAVWRAQEGRTLELRDQYRQARADFWIRLMSAWGMTTSAEHVDAFERQARANYARLAAALVAAGLKRPDRTVKRRAGPLEVVEGARDTKAAKARLIAAYLRAGLPIPTTAGGDVCLDEDACNKSGDPVLRDYGAFGSASKVLTADVPLVRGGTTQPIHAHFEVLLETGDIGCSAPNLVNLPTRPGVRECFVPRPGFVFLAVDYSAIQLRTWAQACLYLLGFSRMAEVLNAGEDPHCMVAADILGTTYADAFARKDEVYYERQCGKVANFGFPGGMGPARLVHAAANQYNVEITEDFAAKLKAIWRRKWPEADPYLEHVRQRTAYGEAQIEQFGSGRLRGGLGYCDTANGLFSALSYDAIKAAGWLVSKACYLDAASPLYGARIVNVIHDELLLEVPEALGHECAEETARLMIAGATPWIPDVPPKTEAVLMRRWSKKAKALRDGAGRLVPWAPEG